VRFANDKRRIMKYLSKMFNIKYRILDLKNAGGTADLSLEIVSIQKDIYKKALKKKELDTFISIALHEVCHILATREGKYAMYHTDKEFESQEEIDLYRRYALTAEIYVDKRANKLCKKLFPKVRFYKSYRNKKERQFLNNWLDTLPKKFYKEVPIAFNLNIEGQ